MKSNFLKKCLIYALMSAILVVQKLILSFIPNFQFSTFLLVLFYFVFGLKPMLLITIIYVIVDNLWMGTLHIIYTPVMLVAWLSIILLLEPIKKYHNNIWLLGWMGAFHGILYSLCFGVATAFLYEIDILAYVIGDVPFTLILMATNFLTIIWLYKPLYNVMEKYYHRIIIENDCKKNKNLL